MMSRILLALTILLGVPGVTLGQTYTDVASQYNISFTNQTLSATGGGVSLVDFNGDGLDDISLATGMGDSLQFYQNTGNGFNKLPAMVNHTSESQQIIWVDYDNDGDKDLYVSGNLSVNKLYRNDQSNGFIDVTSSAGLSSNITETYGVCWGDINKDGWLDFYEANQLNFGTGHNTLYLSDGAGGFTDISVSSNTQDSIKFAFAPAFLDYDKDGWPDLFIANDRLESTTLLKNLGDSTFQNVSSQTGVDEIMDGMCATIGDFDNNGWLDIYSTNTNYGNKLFKNNGNGTFTELADSMGVAFNSETWSALFFDYDHDGDQDLHVCDVRIGSESVQTFFENVDTAFTQPNEFVGDTLKNFASAYGDLNNDGYIDIVSPNKSPSSLQIWEHNGQGSNNWVKVELEGVVTNRDGIGSWIEVYAGGNRYVRYTQCGYGYLGQNSTTEIIGIGSANQVDSIVVRWLNGHVDRFDQLGVNQKYYVKEGSSMNAQLMAMGKLVFCEGDSINTQLKLQKNYASYQWSNGDTTAHLNVSQPGTYSVIVTNSYGLIDTSQSLTISVDSMSVSATAVSDTDNQGLGSATVSVNGGIPPFQYQWNDPQQQTTASASNLQAGTYWVVVTDSLGCTDSIEVVVPNENTSSLTEIDQKTFRVYPNPAEDFVMLEHNGRSYPGFASCQVQVFDTQGRNLMELDWSIANELRIPVKELRKGLYFILLQPVGNMEEPMIYPFSKL